MKIEIDTDELRHLKNFAFNMGDYELQTNCMMLKYYCDAVNRYFTSKRGRLNKYGCMRNPIIITDKKNWYKPVKNKFLHKRQKCRKS